MKVWLDELMCTGCSCCTNICPDVFGRSDSDLAVVLDRGTPKPGIEPTPVPPRFESKVIYAAEECPGEIIFIEYE